MFSNSATSIHVDPVISKAIPTWRKFPVSAWVALDFIFAFGAMLGAYALSPLFKIEWQPNMLVGQVGALTASTSFAVFSAISAHVFGLHTSFHETRSITVFFRCFTAVIIGAALTVLFCYIVTLLPIGRTILTKAALVTLSLYASSRLLVIGQARRHPYRVLLLAPEEVISYVSTLTKSARLGFKLFGHTPYDYNQVIFPSFHEIVVDTQDHHRREIAFQLLQKGYHHVTDLGTFVERCHAQIPFQYIQADWMLRINPIFFHPIYHRTKRIFDFVAATIGLLVASPLLALSALMVYVTSPGPIIYRQTRLGLHGKPFSIIKIRTMRNNAEANGAQWAEKRDTRITAVGRLLRISRIDEIPQFWNVLKGDMSLVGPRPERPEFSSMITEKIPLFVYRTAVKPGITGWAQINYPYGANIEDAAAKLSFDLYYIKNTSLALDLTILMRTIGAIAKGSR